MKRLSNVKLWGFVLGAMFLLGSCSSNSSPTSITSLPEDNQEAVLEQNACIWGYVLDIFNTPVGGATVKMYVIRNGEKELKATYTTNDHGYFQEYYIYSIVVPGDTVIFEASDSTGILTGSSRTYASAAGSSPCIDNDLHYIAHDTIYLYKAGGIIIW